MNTHSEENHIKAIYKLSKRAGGLASTNSLSKELGMKASSVTDMLKKLAEKKLVLYEKYKGARLSKSGEKLALLIIRKHRLWETFLVNKLHFGWDEVHDIAEQLEHIQSEELINRIDQYLSFPKVDPHGDPIPDKNGIIDNVKTVPVNSLTIGANGVIANITHHDTEFLHFLEDSNLVLGTQFKLASKLAFDQSIELKLKSGTIRISNEVASKILATEVE